MRMRMTLPEIDPKAIGARLRRLRHERGWYQQHVARLIGIDDAVLSCLETGRRAPQLHHVIRLAVVYRRSIEWILFGMARRGQLHRLVNKKRPGGGAVREIGSASGHPPPGLSVSLSDWGGAVWHTPPQ